MSTANTHQSLGEIKNKYGRIHEGIEMHELNTIVSETNDSLFTSLKEIVYSNQNVGGTSTESQVYGIHTDLNYKRITLDSKITSLDSSITALNAEKSKLETEKTRLEAKLTTDKPALVDEESKLKDLQKDKKIKEGEINLIRNEKAKKENDMKGLKDGGDKDTLRQEINLLLNNITNLTNLQNGLEFDITEQSKKIANMQNDIRENEREVKQLEEKIKRTSDSLTDPTNQKSRLEERRNKILRMEGEYKKFIDSGSQVFDTTKNIAEKSVAVGTSHNYDPKDDLFQSGITRPTAARYSLYDGEGKSFSSGVLKKVKLSDGTEVDIQGFSINPTTGQIDWTSTITIKKSDTGEQVSKFPISFQMDVGVSVPVDGSLDAGISAKKLNLTNRKIISFKLNRSITGGANLAAEYDAINTRSGNHINTLLAHTHATKYTDARKEVLFKLLGEEIAKDQFAKFTDDQKKTLLTRLVALTAGGYDMNAPAFQTSFKTEVTKDEFFGTAKEFEDQLLKDLDIKTEEKLKKILTDRLETATIGGQKAKTAIVGEFMNYLTTVNIVKDQARRETLYNAVDVRTGGEITRKLAHTHATKYADARKEVLFKLLGEEIDKDQFAKLTDDQKKTLLTRLVALTAGGYDMDVPTFQTSFRTEIAKEDFTGTEEEFEKKLIANLDAKAEEQLKKILEKRLDSASIGGNKARSVLAGEFMNYLSTVNITKDQLRRETLYNAVDVRTGGQITRQLAHVHGQKYKDTKKKVLLTLMEETIGKEAFDKLSDKQKDACLASLVTTGYDMDVPTFQTSFRTEIAKEDFTGTEEEFEKKLIANLDAKAEEQLKKILEKRLDSASIGGNKARSVLAGRFLDYVNNSAFDVPKRHAAFQVLEGNLTAELLQTRLRQEFELKFNKLQREAFEKTLALNPEFGKLNQAQKDRIYERIQELGTINAGAVDVKLGDQPTTPPTPLTYSIPEITFAPTMHQYSLMPNDEDYAGFSTWLVNQLPADVGSDPDKYRDWMRNGLVASLDNGKTHYENFFADVLKKFTDNINVKTTLNQTLLDFINDTNTADHMAFDADLLATLTSTTPLTDHPKKRYQKLMPWVKGEPQNYLSFFQGQSQEFKTESITAGGKTFGYSGKLEIGGAENVNMSIKMKDGQEQIYKSGSPVALVRTLLTSTDLEPPHARFHAGLSVIKSVTKMARSNDISLRTALTPEMLDTLPFSIRTTLAAGENPMVEIEEKDNGKLVATVFNLNLTTRRKENIHTMFDEEAFVATQSVRDLRQGVESLLALTNQTLNNTYANYREASRGSGLRKALLSKHRYGGLANFWKTISFEGETISVGGKTVTLTCKDGLFTFTGEGIMKPIRGRNLGELLTFNPALRGIELKALHVANEKLIETYQEKLEKKDRMKNYGVIDEINHRVYILDKYGNLGYVENTSQDFASRWRQYNSGHSYGRIKDDDMPTGFRVMKKGKNIVDKETYNDFLRNEALVGPMVRAMSRTYRAVTTWAPWD